jgi:hypothetical protein
MAMRQLFKDFFYGFVTEYETPKVVMVQSFTVTILLRMIQTILLLYSIFYLLLYEKGYQKQDTSIISSITLKVKGIGFIQNPKNKTYVIDGAGEFSTSVFDIEQSLFRLHRSTIGEQCHLHHDEFHRNRSNAFGMRRKCRRIGCDLSNRS